MNYIKPYNFYDKLKAKNKKYVTHCNYFLLANKIKTKCGG